MNRFTNGCSMRFCRLCAVFALLFLANAKAFASLPGSSSSAYPCPSSHAPAPPCGRIRGGGTQLLFILSPLQQAEAVSTQKPAYYVPTSNATELLTRSSTVTATADYGGVWNERKVPRLHVPSIRRLLSSLLVTYMRLLNEKPKITKSISAAIVQGLGDVLSQLLSALSSSSASVVGKSFVYDVPRTISFMLTGFLFNAPFLHVWYGTAARFGERLQLSRRLTNSQRIGAELALDQSIGVFMYYPMYFYAYELCSAIAYGKGKLPPFC